MNEPLVDDSEATVLRMDTQSIRYLLPKTGQQSRISVTSGENRYRLRNIRSFCAKLTGEHCRCCVLRENAETGEAAIYGEC